MNEESSAGSSITTYTYDLLDLLSSRSSTIRKCSAFSGSRHPRHSDGSVGGLPRDTATPGIICLAQDEGQTGAAVARSRKTEGRPISVWPAEEREVR